MNYAGTLQSTFTSNSTQHMSCELVEKDSGFYVKQAVPRKGSKEA